ncbi:MAG: flavin reductase [Oscillospiraceae bacterium]
MPGLEWKEGTKVRAPLLSECHASVECKVIQEIEIGGDHVFFVYSVEAVHCDESWLNESGNIDFVKIVLL